LGFRDLGRLLEYVPWGRALHSPTPAYAKRPPQPPGPTSAPMWKEPRGRRRRRRPLLTRSRRRGVRRGSARVSTLSRDAKFAACDDHG
jgi:hypothetical protein